MKAFLLAAGHGTRLRPLTDETPKCLLPICGEPMLSIWLQTCQSLGVDEVLINVHHQAAKVRAFLQAGRSSPRVTVVEEQELLGSGGTLSRNREWVRSDRDFWVFYADVLIGCDLSSMLKRHREKPYAATLGVYRVPDPARCGIVETDSDGVITRFVEKPKHPVSNLAFAGVMIGTPTFLDAIPPGRSDIGYDVLPRLSGKMIAHTISGYLLDIGTMENYRLAQSTWHQNDNSPLSDNPGLLL